MDRFDIVIVGGGIAGASLGARIASGARVALIEAEPLLGYHASGRSAAFWMASYGGNFAQPLTRASRSDLEHGWPSGEKSWLANRGALHLVGPDSDVRDILGVLQGADHHYRAVERPELEQLLPGIAQRFPMAYSEPSCADIDAGGFLASCHAAFRAEGGTALVDSELLAGRPSDDGWILTTTHGELAAGLVVNAAGAWGDVVAQRCGIPPIGLQPKRRTVVQLRLERTGLKHIPLVIYGSGPDGFYFKGEADNRVWLSPTDQTNDVARDVAAEESDVALAIDRFQKTVDWPIAAVERKWAGLRTFTKSWMPAIGEDPLAPRFHWCAGQAGWGFQTAPALSAIAAAAILAEALPPPFDQLDPGRYLPRRWD